MLALQKTAEDEPDYAEAEAALAALAELYPDYASADVAEMLAHVASLESGAVPAAEGAAALFAIAHNVKGQGASFGYDLMTELGEGLCQLLRHPESVGPAELRAVRALVEACATVLAERLTGMGGSRGAALLAEAGLAHTAS